MQHLQLPVLVHISFCTVQLWILCAACFLVTLCPSAAFDPGPEKFSGFWSSMVFRLAPFLGRSQVTTTTLNPGSLKYPQFSSPYVTLCCLLLRFFWSSSSCIFNNSHLSDSFRQTLHIQPVSAQAFLQAYKKWIF